MTKPYTPRPNFLAHLTQSQRINQMENKQKHTVRAILKSIEKYHSVRAILKSIEIL